MLFPSPLPAPPPVSSRPPHLWPLSSPEDKARTDQGDAPGNEQIIIGIHNLPLPFRTNETPSLPPSISEGEKKIIFGGKEKRSRVLNQTQTGLRRGAGVDWKAQVIPAPPFAAIGLWETSIMLSRSGRKLRRMSEASASLQAQGKWLVAEK